MATEIKKDISGGSGAEGSAVFGLFKKYQAQYDPEQRMAEPAADTSIMDLWHFVERQLKLDGETIAEQVAGLAQLPCHPGKIDPIESLLRRIPKKIADRYCVVPVGMEGQEPVLAIANPLDHELLDNLRFLFGTHFRLVIASPSNIEIAIAMGYESLTPGAKKKKAGLLDDKNRDSAIPRLARQLMIKALEKNASDMHIQPFVGGSVVRIRVDGNLQRLVILPELVGNSIVRYFKAKGGMDPTNNMVPQDGRMLLEISDREYDLRISTLPVTGRLEKLVVRFLNRQSVYKLSAIGFSLDEIHTLNRMAASPSGVILVCGPTGSGKTTTLYSLLSSMNREDISIMTVENPVEYQMAGLSQTEINDKAGMTFARALRAILRQDPDIILIGEIRDEETAQIAMQSALTGHLVFSTLHTNDSLSAIPRLLDMGINPVILAESLTGIMSQRLLRKLCTHCKAPLDDNPDPVAAAFAEATLSDQAYRAVGCEQCDYTGYKGRTVVAELVEINPAQRELLLGGEQDIIKFKEAMRGTFNSMTLSASRLIIAGETTAAEAYSVIGQQFWLGLTQEYQGKFPDLSALSETTGKNSRKNSILIMGNLGDDTTSLAHGLEESWFDVMMADSSEKADTVLREHEETVLVVLEIDESLDDQQVIDLVADYRTHVAWSRLPALVRIPGSRPQWEAMLREHGSTSRFISREAPVELAVELIQEAITKKLDFKWGLKGSKVSASQAVQGDTYSAEEAAAEAELIRIENQLGQ